MGVRHGSDAHGCRVVAAATATDGGMRGRLEGFGGRADAVIARNGGAVALRVRSSEALRSKRGRYEVVETRLRCRREGGSREGDEATVPVVGGCGWRRGCLDGIWGIEGRVSG